MAKRTLQGTISFSVTNVPVTIEIDIPDLPPINPGPEPDGSWAHDILGTSTPAAGLDGPELTLQARQGVFDLPESVQELPERFDLQQQLDAADTVCELQPGIYRCGATISRPLEVRGNQQVSIRASDDWSPGGSAGCQWTPVGAAWHSSLQVPDWPVENLGQYEATDPWRAGRPWIVMVDGVRYFIEPTTNGQPPSAGHFQLADRHVVLPFNPEDSWLVEVSVRGGPGAWLNVTSDDVILDRIDFRHAPSGLARWNPLESNAKRIAYLGCMFGFAHGYGPGPGASTGSVAEGCIFHNCGIAGSGGPGINSFQFKSNVLFNNGFGEGWYRDNGSGGIKLTAGSNDVTFDNNASWNNNFAGMWVDIDCQRSVFRNNVLWDNGQEQLHYEISQGGTIEDNVVFRTEHFAAPNLNERTVGFYISSSRQVRIARNLAMHLPSCYEIRWTNRQDMPAGGCNGIVHEDCVAIGRDRPADQAAQWGSDFGLAWLDSEGGALINDPSNVARNNRYGYPGPEPENRWSHSSGGSDHWLSTLASLQAQPKIGSGASYLSESERVERLSRFGLS